jgi:hypothetical protein
MRHRVATAYRCVQAFSKLVQAYRSGRNARASSRILAARTSGPTGSTRSLGSGPVRVTPHSRSDQRTTPVLQWVDHCITRQPWSM